MADEPTEEKINREVIYVYEPITSFEEKAEKFGIKSERNIMLYYEGFCWNEEKEELRKDRSFFGSLISEFFSGGSSNKKGLDSAHRVLIETIAEFKKSLYSWMPEIGQAYCVFVENEKERNFMQVHEGKEVESLTTDSIEKLYQEYLESLPQIYEGGVQKIKEKTPNAHVLTVDKVQKLCDSGDLKVLNVKKFAQGQVLVKHPFMPNTYMNIETSESELFHIKMQCLSRIMQCLGASRIKGHAYVKDCKQRQMDESGKVSYKLIDANGSYQSVKNEQYESDYILEDSFSGDFSEESYNEAIAEAKQVGLYEDFDIKNLFDQRNPQKQNKMTGRKIKIEMTRELNESLDVAFSLQAAGFGMDGSYKEILKTQRNVMFELEIEF